MSPSQCRLPGPKSTESPSYTALSPPPVSFNYSFGFLILLAPSLPRAENKFLESQKFLWNVFFLRTLLYLRARHSDYIFRMKEFICVPPRPADLKLKPAEIFSGAWTPRAPFPDFSRTRREVDPGPSCPSCKDREALLVQVQSKGESASMLEPDCQDTPLSILFWGPRPEHTLPHPYQSLAPKLPPAPVNSPRPLDVPIQAPLLLKALIPVPLHGRERHFSILCRGYCFCPFWQ